MIHKTTTVQFCFTLQDLYFLEYQYMKRSLFSVLPDILEDWERSQQNITLQKYNLLHAN